MDLDYGGQRSRVLVHDRDTKFSRAFDAVLEREGFSIIRTPIRRRMRTPRRSGG